MFNYNTPTVMGKVTAFGSFTAPTTVQGGSFPFGKVAHLNAPALTNPQSAPVMFVNNDPQLGFSPGLGGYLVP